MPLDLYGQETVDRLSTMPGVEVPEPSMFQGFARGTGMLAMRGFASTARAVDLAGSIGPIVEDAFTGGTEAQDRYFKEHDEVFGSAVDYWTPKPSEVGSAARVVGPLVSMFPTVFTSPGLAVLGAGLGTGEELVKRGVPAEKAGGMALIEGGATGLGIWMPILGQNLWQRVLLGGAGYNVVQGLGVRGAGQVILAGTPAEKDYRALDPEAITLDALLGMAFGTFAHLSPAQREAGASAWNKIRSWVQAWKPSEVDALAAMRQAQHLNVDSTPGRPIAPEDVIAHTERLKTAIEQLARNEPVDVSDRPMPNTVPDEARVAEAQRNFEFLQAEAERVRQAEGIPRPEDFGPIKTPTVDVMAQAIDKVGDQRFQQLVGEHLASFGERLSPRDEAFAVEQVARWIVGGAFERKLEIPLAERLTPEQRVVETHAREQVLSDLEANVRDYAKLPESEGGKILNTDVARELFPEYRAARYLHSPSVHEPASALVKELYTRALAEPDPHGLNMVTFTAGGTGAGKTTALGAVPLASKVVEASQIVYDTNMASFKSGVQKVDQALAAGKQVNIMYVGADPEEALRRALSRAMRTGRTVPLVEHAKTHQGSADTIAQMMEHYKGNDQVQFVILDNGAGAKGEVHIVEPAKAGAYFKSLNFKNLPERLQGVLDAEKAAGRINEAIYQGTAHGFPEEAGAAPGARGAGEPAGGGEALRDEPGGDTGAPAPGQRFIVYRLGETAGTLANRNAGNADSVARYIMGTEDALGPISSKAQKVFAYEVTVDQPFGKYEGLTAAREGAQGTPGRTVRGDEVAYSFPKEGYQAKLVGQTTLQDLRAALTERGHASFDDAGTKIGAEVIREQLAPERARIAQELAAPGKAQAPAEAPIAQGAPEGEGKPGTPGAKVEIDPLTHAADRFAAENQDLLITVGQNVDGTPIQRRPGEILEDARLGVEDARAQADLYRAAATCLMGGG